MSDFNPTVFISYSWSCEDHESWVLELAESLLRDGVDVKLDKWDLKEGHDLNHFMESMVRDPSITKVIIVFDKKYVDRANDKKGGVGTETQIISNEVYGSVDQNKFVGVVRERDEEGEAFVPIYYRGRKYIDLSDDSSYHAQYEILLRWVYNQPLYDKPKLGVKPAFLDDSSNRIDAATASAYRALLILLKKIIPTQDPWQNRTLIQFF
ncbi:toll/interleukin-1 receptor domain-containing protein [Halomonas sp. BC04]|uniref:toll/interleukin-1 receptor domain-containing protein n=1 Tax=Halomonas sp. BC04 TaxID=1403540 RepID=UPI0018CC741E|nr:toll/interleukin-1 receptor domain-containing protein [Halomonas sp. BC04]